VDDGAADEVDDGADWHRRVVDRSLKSATKKSIDRGGSLIEAASLLLERSNGEGFTVQDVADEAGQSLRTLYQYFASKDDLMLAVFEEAMRLFARMIRYAIADLDDPVDRLAGGILAAARMHERSTSGVDRGLARLRLHLAEVEPELIARSRQPVTAVFEELVTEAAAARGIDDVDPQEAAYLIAAMNSTYVSSLTLGNDFGMRMPDVLGLTKFCLGGLGASLEPGWQDRLSKAIKMPPKRAASTPLKQTSTRAPRKRSASRA